MATARYDDTCDSHLPGKAFFIHGGYMVTTRIGLTAAVVLLLAGSFSAQEQSYEGQPSALLANDRLQLQILLQGGAIGSFVLQEEPQKLNPMWNPLRTAREQGRTAQFSGVLGHFVCVDGFGQPSAEERAAGLPQHGEAHTLKMEAVTAAENGVHSVALSAKLPIAQEVFTRTFRAVDGENVVYVDSQLENLLGFDRPVHWAEHATVAAPFLEAGVSRIFLSGSRSQTRDFGLNQGRGNLPAPGAGAQGAPAPGPARGGGSQRRLKPGIDFTWPMAPGADGSTIDLSTVPQDPHFTDHSATLFDPSRPLAWAVVLNPGKRMIYGYIFKSAEYPWIQNWGNYSSAAQVVHGLEFGTQPYDVSRREAVSTGSLFGTPTYRWLPAKSKIESHFIVFFAMVPEGMKQVDSVRLENGLITIEDRATGKQLPLKASRGL
jgi:hypothetical protein